MVDRIRPTDEAVLKALAVYRFLTPKQLMRLAVTTEKSHLYEVLRRLKAQNPPHQTPAKGTASIKHRSPALVREFRFGPVPTLGRPDSIYTLTPRGAAVLTEGHRHDQTVQVPRDAILFTSDYRHRVGCVDFHIALRAWAASAGVTLDFFDAYYDPGTGGGKGRTPRAKTRITFHGGSLNADAIFALTDAKGVQKLYAFELYNGRNTGYVIEQLTDYLRAIGEEAIEKTYKYEKYAARILCAFDDVEGMRLVCERMMSLPGFMDDSASFWLADKKVIDTQFSSAWMRFDRKPSFPF